MRDNHSRMRNNSILRVAQFFRRTSTEAEALSIDALFTVATKALLIDALFIILSRYRFIARYDMYNMRIIIHIYNNLLFVDKML